MAQPPLRTAAFYHRAEEPIRSPIEITADKTDLLFLLVMLACLAFTAGLLVVAPVAGILLLGLQCLASLLMVVRAVLVCRFDRGAS
ncbi:hypothetical protein [Thalassospira mesophila]|uniref:Uncharacterized protein n=1 Tax=Thalassospira mesophila TaxID=1293891 RepID=A0A1Y2KWV3_9PROT|nr:hypothetical protein [Thalassospira mesophila]OSQ35504.1 hypothetical protein TMES_21045 [Thalassospira mesophila]